MKRVLPFLMCAYLLLPTMGLSQTFSGQPIRVQLSEIPKPKLPADLHISGLQFSELSKDKNQMLDAEESVEIKFLVTNKGLGEAYRLQPIITKGLVKELISEPIPAIGTLKPNESSWITFKLNASFEVQDGEVQLVMLIKEGNGFDSDPAILNFKTQAFRAPNLVIADAIFTNNEGEGKISLGKLITFEILVHNKGQGKAEGISIDFQLPEKAFPSGESMVNIPLMNANQQERIRFEFFANKLYAANEIPVTVVINESYGKFGSNSTFPVSLEKTLNRTQTLQIAGKELQKIEITGASLVSDIDRDIPKSDKTNLNRYALIIGNEEYSKYQRGLQVESNVRYARNDALIIKQYFEKTLGIPSSNIDLRIDATSGEMSQAIDRLKRIIKNTNGEAEVFMYYAGHGLPSDDKEPYLIPVDVTGANVTLGVKLSDMYSALSEYPSKRVTVILDACFSGGARGETLLAMRGVKITPNQQRIKGNMLVLTASSGDQPSLPFQQQQHGIFTYYLLKKLQQTGGNLTYGELANYLEREVSLQSVLVNDKEQNPKVLFSDDIESVWTNWKF